MNMPRQSFWTVGDKEDLRAARKAGVSEFVIGLTSLL